MCFVGISMGFNKGFLFIVGTVAVLCFASGLLSGAILFHDDRADGMQLQGTMTDNDLLGIWEDTEFVNGMPYTIYYTFLNDNTVIKSGNRPSETFFWHSKVIGDDTPDKGFTPIYYKGDKLSSVYCVWINQENIELRGNPSFVYLNGKLYGLTGVLVSHLEPNGMGASKMR